jgi:cell division protein FtsN
MREAEASKDMSYPYLVHVFQQLQLRRAALSDDNSDQLCVEQVTSRLSTAWSDDESEPVAVEPEPEPESESEPEPEPEPLSEPPTAVVTPKPTVKEPASDESASIYYYQGMHSKLQRFSDQRKC